MTRFGRFLVLALVGFALGAGLAYYQHSKDTAVTSDEIVAGAPEMPATDTTAPASDTSTTAVAGSEVGGPFSLTDHNGVAVTEASYPGKVKLVFFGFTTCPDVCPATMDKLSTALTTLGVDADKVQTLFITTDPKTDTSEALKAYVSKYNASIVGLTGTDEQLKAVQDGYKVFASTSADGTPNHSSYVYLVSEDNKLLETFSIDASADDLVTKVKAHLVNGTMAPAAAMAPVDATAPVTTEGAVIDQTAPLETTVSPNGDVTTTPSIETPAEAPAPEAASPDATDSSTAPAAE